MKFITTNDKCNRIKRDQTDCNSILLPHHLENALKEFTKLSIDSMQLNPVPRRMERNVTQYRAIMPFAPYEIPDNIVKALLRYKQNNQKKASEATANSSHQQEEMIINLPRIQLKGCNFHGRPIPSRRESFCKLKPGHPVAKPCWLQHRQHRHAAYQKEQEENVPLNFDNEQSGGSEEGRENQPDPGLNELSDYFQHFVCLCAPKMSDLAQSMYI